VVNPIKPIRILQSDSSGVRQYFGTRDICDASTLLRQGTEGEDGVGAGRPEHAGLLEAFSVAQPPNT
jgi:hypothetical protein